MDIDSVINRSALLLQALSSLLSDTPAVQGQRAVAAFNASTLSIDHGQAVRLLVEQGFATSAAAMLRCQYEAFMRAVWLNYCASDDEVALLSAQLAADTSEKHIPTLGKMLDALRAKPELINLTMPLLEMKTHGWAALNSYVHAGAHALNRNMEGFPPPLALGIVQLSNNLTAMAVQGIGIMTGQKGVFAEVIALISVYQDCFKIDPARM